jgi:hypothetical protein
MVLWLTVASLPTPTGRQNRPLYTLVTFSLVKSLASWNIPPNLAQYRSDRLAFVCLTSGRDFLPIVKILYDVEGVVSSYLTDDHSART